jgi:hypothetical protein
VRDAVSNDVLATGALPEIQLQFGSSWFNDTVFAIKPVIGPTAVAAIVSRLLRNEAVPVVVDADVLVSVLGIHASLSVSKNFALGGSSSDAPPPDPSKPTLRWRSVAVVANDQDATRLEVTLSKLFDLPMLRFNVPDVVEFDVLYNATRVANVVPNPNATEPGGHWAFQQGWSTISAIATLPHSSAVATGALMNEYLADRPFNVTVVGAATAASFGTCWLQQVLSNAPLVASGSARTNSATTPTVRLAQLRFDDSAGQGLRFYVNTSLAHEFDTSDADEMINPDEDADDRIHLRGTVPDVYVRLGVRAAPVNDPTSTTVVGAKLFASITAHNWTLTNGPYGIVDMMVVDYETAALAVDALTLHQRNAWIEIDVDSPPTSNDTLSAIINELVFAVPFLVNLSDTAPKTSDLMLSQLRVHVNDFDSQRLCADVTTSMEGASFLDDGLVISANVTNLEASFVRTETSDYLGDAKINVTVAGPNITAHVCSRNLSATPLVRIIEDTINDVTSVTVIASGTLKITPASSILTRVLQYVNYTKTFVDAPIVGLPVSKHFYLQSLQNAGGRGSVAHMLVRYQLRGNKYIDLDTPNIGLTVSAGADQLVSVRVLPVTLVRGNHTQEFEVLLDVGDIDKVGRVADRVLDGVTMPFTVSGARFASLTANIQAFGRGTALEARDTMLTPILGVWRHTVTFDKPTTTPVDGDDAVIPRFDFNLRPGSSQYTLKLRLALNLTMPASFVKLVFGNLDFTMSPPGATRYEFFRVTTENAVVLQPGLNQIAFLLDVVASPNDGTLKALQDAIFKVVATPDPVSVSLVGHVSPISSPGGIDPEHEPPFTVLYDFVLPRGGAGNSTSVMLCQDNPIVNINYDASSLLHGTCSVDISMLTWFRNPIAIPVAIKQLHFSLQFDDPDGAFPHLGIYGSPKYNIVLGEENENALNFTLDSYGISPLNVVVKHPTSDPNGWHETCLRAASQYYIDNTLVVRLQNGWAMIVVDKVFQLPIFFANVSFAIDKNVKLNTTCEKILIHEGLLPPSPSSW